GGGRRRGPSRGPAAVRSCAGAARAGRRRPAPRRPLARKTGIVADGREVLVVLRVPAEALVGCDGLVEEVDCGVGLARERLGAGEVVEDRRAPRLGFEALAQQPSRLVVPPLLHVWDREECVLPGRDLVRRPGLAADCERRGAVGQRDRATPKRRIADEDELT